MKIINKWRPRTTIEIILCLSNFILIPGLSILLGSQESLLYDNLTFIGNQTGFRNLFQAWGVCVSLNYFSSFLYLLKQNNEQRMDLPIIAILLCSLSVLSFFIPYDVKGDSLLANIHVFTSLFASVGTFILIIYYLYTKQERQFYFYHNGIRVLQFFLPILFILLFVLGDISGILEIIMALFLAHFLYYLIKLNQFTKY